MCSDIAAIRRYIVLHWMVAANPIIRKKYFSNKPPRISGRKNWPYICLSQITEEQQSGIANSGLISTSYPLGGFIKDPLGFYFFADNLHCWAKGLLIEHRDYPSWYTSTIKRWLYQTARPNFIELYKSLESDPKPPIVSGSEYFDALSILKNWRLQRNIDLSVFKYCKDSVSQDILAASHIKLSGSAEWLGYVQIPSDSNPEDAFFAIVLGDTKDSYPTIESLHIKDWSVQSNIDQKDNILRGIPDKSRLNGKKDAEILIGLTEQLTDENSKTDLDLNSLTTSTILQKETVTTDSDNSVPLAESHDDQVAMPWPPIVDARATDKIKEDSRKIHKITFWASNRKIIFDYIAICLICLLVYWTYAAYERSSFLDRLYNGTVISQEVVTPQYLADKAGLIFFWVSQGRIIALYPDGLYLTLDHGSSWMKIYSADVNNFFNVGIQERQFIVENDKGVYASTDLGQHWLPIIERSSAIGITPQYNDEIGFIHANERAFYKRYIRVDGPSPSLPHGKAIQEMHHPLDGWTILNDQQEIWGCTIHGICALLTRVPTGIWTDFIASDIVYKIGTEAKPRLFAVWRNTKNKNETATICWTKDGNRNDWICKDFDAEIISVAFSQDNSIAILGKSKHGPKGIVIINKIDNSESCTILFDYVEGARVAADEDLIYFSNIGRIFYTHFGQNQLKPVPFKQIQNEPITSLRIHKGKTLLYCARQNYVLRAGKTFDKWTQLNEEQLEDEIIVTHGERGISRMNYFSKSENDCFKNISAGYKISNFFKGALSSRQYLSILAMPPNAVVKLLKQSQHPARILSTAMATSGNIYVLTTSINEGTKLYWAKESADSANLVTDLNDAMARWLSPCKDGVLVWDSDFTCKYYNAIANTFSTVFIPDKAIDSGLCEMFFAQYFNPIRIDDYVIFNLPTGLYMFDMETLKTKILVKDLIKMFDYEDGLLLCVDSLDKLHRVSYD